MDGSSQGSAIIATGDGSWLVCGVAGSADTLSGLALMIRIGQRKMMKSATADLRQFFILSSLES